MSWNKVGKDAGENNDRGHAHNKAGRSGGWALIRIRVWKQIIPTRINNTMRGICRA